MFSNFFLFVWIVIKIVCIAIPLFLTVAYLTFIERKGIGFIQSRIGPNRVGPQGLLQPIADVIKLITKEIIIPTAANRYLFLLAPIITIAPALAAWAVIPFSEQLALTKINAGILYLFAVTSLSVYGILIAGWATNSKYALLGSLRAAAQTISYEIPMGFSFIGVLLAAGSMNLHDIVAKQQGGFWHWYCFPLFPLFICYWISGIAETNRAPFDLAEGESEIVAGFHVEYSGVGFALFFLAEYMNMILISAIASLLFLGGWLSPFQGIPGLEPLFFWIPSIIWLFLKMGLFLTLFIWSRATFPRYRYDQLMRLGWKVLIPVTLFWVVLVAIAVQFQWTPWFTIGKIA